MRIKNRSRLAMFSLAFSTVAWAASAPSPDELAFRDLYKQLVESNTTR